MYNNLNPIMFSIITIVIILYLFYKTEKKANYSTLLYDLHQDEDASRSNLSPDSTVNQTIIKLNKTNNEIIINDEIKKDIIKIIEQKNNEDNYLKYVKQLLINRDYSVLNDPLVAPERRLDIRQYPLINPINIPTRGYPDNYQLMGILHRESDEKILQLFGRPTYKGSNLYEYYVTSEQYGFTNKIPIKTRGDREILDRDEIHVEIFDKSKGIFKAKIYDYNTPRYNPLIF